MSLPSSSRKRIVRVGVCSTLLLAPSAACGSSAPTVESAGTSPSSSWSHNGSAVQNDLTITRPAGYVPNSSKIGDNESAAEYLASVAEGFGSDLRGDVVLGTAPISAVREVYPDVDGGIGSPPDIDRDSDSSSESEYIVMAIRDVDTKFTTDGPPSAGRVELEGDTLLVTVSQSSGIESRTVMWWEDLRPLFDAVSAFQ